MAHHLKRDAGAIGLLFASTTSMVGSGWLFGAYHAAKLAGPLSIFSWIIGAVIIGIIALCFAELATIFPRSGALVHMSYASHGPGLGRAWGWLLFLAYVPIPAVEAEAVVTYANSYLPVFIQPDSDGLLTGLGIIASMVILAIFALLNLLSVKKLLGFNTLVTWWKIIIPAIAVMALLATSFHTQNLTAAPDSYSVIGMFTALPIAGVIFSFLGFRTAIDLAGESRNPSKTMPIAVIGSLILALVVYVTLQLAFILAIDPKYLNHGWKALSFGFEATSGPFAALALTAGMGWLATLIYVDAYVSPAGTGWMMMTGGTRILMANGQLHAGPQWLTWINKAGVPWTTVIIMWAAGCLFLLPFPAWQQMAGYISAITVLTYGLGPVVLLCLRRNAPNTQRPFKLWAGRLIAVVAFIASNWVVYWTGYYTNQFMFCLIGIGFIAYALYYHWIAKYPVQDFGWRQIAWLLPWFAGMWVISGLGDLGGLGLLNFSTALAVIALWSLVVLITALKTSFTSQQTEQAIHKIMQAKH